MSAWWPLVLLIALARPDQVGRSGELGGVSACWSSQRCRPLPVPATSAVCECELELDCTRGLQRPACPPSRLKKLLSSEEQGMRHSR